MVCLYNEVLFKTIILAKKLRENYIPYLIPFIIHFNSMCCCILINEHRKTDAVLL